jgi:REP-associated tyrosine transposase
MQVIQPRKRCERWNVPGDAHELTFSCFKQRPFLKSDTMRGMVLEAIDRARATHRIHVWAYVLMPEHVHLLIWPGTDPYSISAILKSLKQSVARRAVRHIRTACPEGLKHLHTGQRHSPYRFWQDGGGYDRNIRSRAALRRAVAYIHENPVRRGLVECAEEWPWSSAHEWLEEGSGLLRIDRESYPTG